MFANRTTLATKCLAVAFLFSLQPYPPCLRGQESSGFFFVAPLSEVEFSNGKLPVEEVQSIILPTLAYSPEPRAWSVAKVESAYAQIVPSWVQQPRAGSRKAYLICKTDSRRTVQGVISTFQLGKAEPRQLKFEIHKDDWQLANSATSDQFYAQQDLLCSLLAQRKVKGAAWFRFLSNLAQKELGVDYRPAVDRRTGFSHGIGWPDSVIQSENLDLSAVKQYSLEPDENRTSLEEVEAFELSGIDWNELAQLEPDQTDRLALVIPGDQHAVFFDSFENLVAALDYIQNESLPFRAILLESSFSDLTELRTRYEARIGLTLGGLARALGPQLIESVAITGGDPFFEGGTDVAILFEPKREGGHVGLAKLIEIQIATNFPSSKKRTAKNSFGKGIEYISFINSITSSTTYIAKVGDLVVVTTSLSQLKSIAAVHNNEKTSLAEQPGYKMFRGNYPLDPSQTGLLVVSEAAINRWASPKIRIGSARRLAARAAMADVQCALINSRATQSEWNPRQAIEPYQGLLKDLRIDKGQVKSEFGDLSFLTPISELDFKKVTDSEQFAYRDWKRQQERYSFPISGPFAFQFRASKDYFRSESTIVSPRRKEMDDLFYGFIQDSQVDETTADPHSESLLHLTLAYNRESTGATFLRTAIQQAASDLNVGNVNDWFNGQVGLYIDDGAYWDEHPDFFNTVSWPKKDMPIALRIGLSRTSEPNQVLAVFAKLLNWNGNTKQTKHEFMGVPYVELSTGFAEMLYVTATPKQFLMTPSKTLLERSLSRELDHEGPAEELLDIDQWPGRSMNLQIKGRFKEILMSQFSNRSDPKLRHIPILNEWKRMFPDRKPTEVHHEFYGGKLSDMYKWIEEYGTMTPDTQNERSSKIPFADLKSIAIGMDVESNAIHVRVRGKMSD